jgi:hypothetical protein
VTVKPFPFSIETGHRFLPFGESLKDQVRASAFRSMRDLLGPEGTGR